MAVNNKNWARVTATTTGTGTFTLSTAVTGYATFALAGIADGDTVNYSIFGVDSNGNPSGEYEVGAGTYTSAGTTLSRVIVYLSSNSNALVNFSAGTKHVIQTTPAEAMDQKGALCQYRLTTESGVPVSTSDRTAQATIYMTPMFGNAVRVFNGRTWQVFSPGQLSLSASGTSGDIKDVFLDYNSGTLQLVQSAAWTNSTTRADALTTQDGVYVKSGSTTLLWLGTVKYDGTNTVADSANNRFIWNNYNRVPRSLKKTESTASWTYGTATWRSMNNSTTNRVEFVRGLNQDPVHCIANMSATGGSTGGNPYIGIGLDRTNGNDADITGIAAGGSAVTLMCQAVYNNVPGLGYHYLQAVEFNDNGATTYTAYGTIVQVVSGLSGWAMA